MAKPRKAPLVVSFGGGTANQTRGTMSELREQLAKHLAKTFWIGASPAQVPAIYDMSKASLSDISPGWAALADEVIRQMEWARRTVCVCEFDPRWAECGDKSVNFTKVCRACGREWGGLHCEHDGYQNPCPDCGTRPDNIPDGGPLTPAPEGWTP